MKILLLLSFLLALAVCSNAAEYQWGVCGPKDHLIAKDKVTKSGTFGLVKHKKYVLKQKANDALTITCIIVTDRSKKCDGIAELDNGGIGIGSKGLTMNLKSKRGGCIKSLVKVYGR